MKRAHVAGQLLGVGVFVLVVGCQTAVEPVEATRAPRVAAPAAALSAEEKAAQVQAIRVQYRRQCAKDLMAEAELLRKRGRPHDASQKMRQAKKLLEGLPEEE